VSPTETYVKAVVRPGYRRAEAPGHGSCPGYDDQAASDGFVGRGADGPKAEFRHELPVDVLAVERAADPPGRDRL